MNGRAAGQTGSFTVNTSFTSEPGMLCSNFPNIGRSQTVDGKLPSSGCLALDGTPYEAYTLTTDGAGTLTVTVASQDFTPVIAVRSIDGRPLSLPSASPVNVVLAGDSQYLVIISSADTSTGAYQIANTYQTADNETCRSQKTLADSDSDSNAITADSCFVTIAGSGDQSYYNYYNFTLTAAGAGECERGQRRFHRHAQPAGCRRQHAGLRFRRRRQRRAVQRACPACARNSRRAATACRSSATFLPAATTRSSTRFRPAIRNPARPARSILAIS